MPVRIQRKRTKGWKMPEGAVYVGRGSAWGNPWTLNDAGGNAQEAVAAFRRLFEGQATYVRHQVLTLLAGASKGRGEGHIAEMKSRLPELRGKDLACWCRLDQPCHADVLLELANSPTGDR